MLKQYFKVLFLFACVFMLSTVSESVFAEAPQQKSLHYVIPKLVLSSSVLQNQRFSKNKTFLFYARSKVTDQLFPLGNIDVDGHKRTSGAINVVYMPFINSGPFIIKVAVLPTDNRSMLVRWLGLFQDKDKRVPIFLSKHVYKYLNNIAFNARKADWRKVTGMLAEEKSTFNTLVKDEVFKKSKIGNVIH